MSSVVDLLWRLRQKLSDMNDAQTSSWDKLIALNDGNKYVAELARKYNPAMLVITEAGTATTATNTLTSTPLKLLEVRVDGALVTSIDPRTIADKATVGTIARYWVTGNKVVNWYPVPRDAIAFSVEMIPSATAWTEVTADSGWVTEIEDCILEMAFYTISKQADQVAMLTDKVVQLISQRETGDAEIGGYWNTPTQRSDY